VELWSVGNKEEMGDDEGIGKGVEVDERRMGGRRGKEESRKTEEERGVMQGKERQYGVYEGLF